MNKGSFKYSWGNILKAGLIFAYLAFFLLQCSATRKSKEEVASPEYTQPTQPYNWIVTLEEVNRPGITSPGGFRDEKLNISLEVLPNLLSLRLENISEDSLYIVWNDCLFEFPGGFRSKIVHSEVAFADRNLPLLNEYIFPQTQEARFIAPRVRTDWNRNQKTWRSYPLLQGEHADLVGKEFAFILFIHYQGNLVPYVFKFLVRDTYPVELNRRGDRITQKKPWYREGDPESVGKRLFSDPETSSVQSSDPQELQEEPPILEENLVAPENAPSDSLHDTLVQKPDLSLRGGFSAPKSKRDSLGAKSPPPAPEENLSESQKGIKALLQRRAQEKQPQESKKASSPAVAPAPQESTSEKVSTNIQKNDSLKRWEIEQEYLESLKVPENIPLFEKNPEKSVDSAVSASQKDSILNWRDIPPDPLMKSSPGSF